MARHLEGIDHCVVIVDDLAQAAETYARLGFMVSPLGRHDAEMGTGNRIILFERDYLELLGVLRPTHFNREVGQLAEMREGIAAIAAGVAAGATVGSPRRNPSGRI